MLLVLRRREPEAGCWGLPGGKVDWREGVAAAVDREIAEELGIVIQSERLLCVVDQISETEHWIAPVYLIESFLGEAIVQEPEALAGCDWFPLDGPPARLTHATREALAAYKRVMTPN